MREELDKKLVETFPNLYSDRLADLRRTAMCWGFECGDGWFDLIRECSIRIEAEILKMPENERQNCRASQVKEKFGTLRFYMTAETDAIREAISIAEKKSSVTCENCGNPGIERGGGWIQTLCDECYKPITPEQKKAADNNLYRKKDV